jgi:sodium pump decarboxylase gamma subunit
MGTVYLFLVVMIVIMKVIAGVIQKFFPKPVNIAQGECVNQTQTEVQADKKVVAAIVAAILQDRQGR